MEQYWKGRSVLVTGCTGLMGSWLVERLLHEGAKVVGLVRDTAPASQLILSKNAKRISIVQGDLCDYQTVLRACNEYEVDTCFHLAAQTIVSTASASPLSTFDSNIRGTWTLLEAMRVARPNCDIVIASSDKAYGSHKKLPYDESMSLDGTFPYDVSKACAEAIGRSYNATYGMNIAISRCANLFGGGDLNFNRLVPGTMIAALKNEPIVIRSDGTYKRDYLYVEDAAEAYLRLGAAVHKFKGEAFNFGGAAPITVLEMVKAISDAIKKDIPIKVSNTAKHEIRDQYLAVDKAKEHLGFVPRHDLKDALRKTYEWYARYHSEGLF